MLPGFPLKGLVEGADSTRRVDISMMVWLLKKPDGRNVLVDSGFHVRLQQPEYDHHTSPGLQNPSTGVAPADVAVLERLQATGRPTLVDGDDREILPGIVAYTGGRHTFATQYLTVHTAEGTVVVASDNVYLYLNLERRAPIGLTLDRASNLAAQARMLKLATSPRLIVPGHDPAVFVRFPEPGDGVARIR